MPFLTQRPHTARQRLASRRADFFLNSFLKVLCHE